MEVNWVIQLFITEEGMREWVRITEKFDLANLPEECKAAIDEHSRAHNLSPDLERAVMGIKVNSHKIKKGPFTRKPKAVESFVFLTSEWLVWTISTDGDSPVAVSARLAEIFVEDYALSPNFELFQDNGISITGKLTGKVGLQGQEQVSIFIGLGEEPSAEKFRIALFEAVEKSRR
jgi:hypothetical protein